jgi:hypothetical protein
VTDVSSIIGERALDVSPTRDKMSATIENETWMTHREIARHLRALKVTDLIRENGRRDDAAADSGFTRFDPKDGSGYRYFLWQDDEGESWRLLVARGTTKTDIKWSGRDRRGAMTEDAIIAVLDELRVEADLARHG